MRTKPNRSKEWGTVSWTRKDAQKVLPQCFQKMEDIYGRSQPWERGVQTLSSAGFVPVAWAKSFDRPWSKEDDPMGELQEPLTRESFRFHAMMVHPEGFLVEMNSYQRNPAKTAQQQEQNPWDTVPPSPGSLHVVNSMSVYYSIDFGANVAGLDAVMSSGQSRCTERGLSLSGYDNVITGNKSLKSILVSIYANARPKKLAQWDPCFVYIEPSMYSQVPSSSWAAESVKIEEHFKERLAADKQRFLKALPEDLRAIVCERTKQSRYTFVNSVCERAVTIMERQGHQWPSMEHQETLKGWLSIWDAAILSHAKKGEYNRIERVPNTNKKYATGGNIMHALACLTGSLQELAPLVEWFKSLPVKACQQWMSELDDSGLSPCGVALESALSTRGWMHTSEELGIAAVFRESGYCCAPGEIGTLLSEVLGDGSEVGRRRQSTLNQEIVQEAIEVCVHSQVDWLTPMSPEGASPILDTQEAARTLLASENANVLGPQLRAAIESLILSQSAPVTQKLGSIRRV